jgi:5'-3' exonuclease
MNIHLIDGTYELFRAHFAVPPAKAPDGREVGAVRGLIRTLLLLLRQDDVSHVGFAFDHVVESFRNDLFAGYKTGEGTPPELLNQFPLAERTAAALGMTVWPMIEFEADDALATAAARWKGAPGVDQVVICSPDKDLTQMVEARKVVCLDRRREVTLDEDGVVDKFGVSPESIPDYLGLVGDSADGIPGIPKWGAKTSSRMLARYKHIESIPKELSQWDVELRGAAGISTSLEEHREDALFYRKLATLRLDVPLPESLEQIEWQGVRRDEFDALCAEIGFSNAGVQDREWRAGT